MNTKTISNRLKVAGYAFEWMLDQLNDEIYTKTGEMVVDWDEKTKNNLEYGFGEPSSGEGTATLESGRKLSVNYTVHAPSEWDITLESMSDENGII